MRKTLLWLALWCAPALAQFPVPPSSVVVTDSIPPFVSHAGHEILVIDTTKVPPDTARYFSDGVRWRRYLAEFSNTIIVAPGDDVCEALAKLNDGGAIWFLPGVHYVTAKCVITKSKISFIGFGASTVFRPKTSATSIDTLFAFRTGDSSSVGNFRIEGARQIDVLLKFDQYSFTRVFAAQFDSANVNGLRFDNNSKDNIITDVLVNQANGDGIVFNISDNNWLVNARVYFSQGSGIRLVQSDEVIITNADANQNVLYGVYASSPATPIYGVQINGGRFTSSGRHNILLQNAKLCQVQNALIKSAGTSAVSTYNGVALDGSDNNSVIGNIFYDYKDTFQADRTLYAVSMNATSDTNFVAQNHFQYNTMTGLQDLGTENRYPVNFYGYRAHFTQQRLDRFYFNSFNSNDNFVFNTNQLALLIGGNQIMDWDTTLIRVNQPLQLNTNDPTLAGGGYIGWKPDHFSANHGGIKVNDGTGAVILTGVQEGDTYSAGDVLTISGAGTITWETPGAGISVEEGDALLSASISTLDFGAGFDLTETPAGEANIVLDYSEDPVNLASADVTGTLPVGNGGTGVTSLSDILGTSNEITVSGGTNAVIGGNVTLSLPTSLDLSGKVLVGNTLFSIEGSSVNSSETTLEVVNPTSDRTITFPNASGTVAVSASSPVSLSSGGQISITSNGIGPPHIDETANYTWTGSHDFDNAEITSTNALRFEGATNNNIYTIFAITDPTTSSKTITFPNASGTVSLLDQSIESSEITDGEIVNADISASAAISLSKLASGSSAQIIVGDASGVPTYRTLSGDATISNTGVLTIADNSVDGGDISVSSETLGDILYFNGTDWVRLGIGTSGQALKVSGGLPAWGTDDAGSAITVEESNSTVVSSLVSLDFGAGFDVTETPTGEANVVHDYTEDPVNLASSEITGTLAVGNGGTGVTSLSNVLGTSNEVSVSNGTARVIGGNVTLSLPTQLTLSAKELQGGTLFIAEGATANASETTFALDDPTADRTITFPNASGEVSLLGQTITSSEITDGEIVNADISASAAIALSKLAAGSSGQIIVANVSGVPTYVAMSSDATISNAGALTISDNAVDGTDISIASEATGALTYFNGTDWVVLTPGSEDDVLTLVAGVPAWVTDVGGTEVTVQEGDATVATDVFTFDFGAGFDVSETPASEVNIVLDYSEDPVNLASGDVTGLLGVANGGTGADLSATGGSNQFLKQSSTGAVITVGTIGDADVPNTITLDNITQITTRDHGSLTGLTDDDHTIYALLAGRSGGQTLIGGTGASENLVLESTANASKGVIWAEDRIYFDDVTTFIELEGSSADAFETVLVVTNPTADRTITFPDDDGEVSLLGQSISSSEIGNGAILDIDISASAAIALSKLASGSSAQIIVANGSGVPTYVAMSGDATIATTGALTISDNAVDGTDISLASEATGNIMYFNGTDWVRLATGTDGQVLKLASGAPGWGTDNTGGGGSIDAEEGDVSAATAISVIDFGTGFDVSESPDGEANITFDPTEIGSVTWGAADGTWTFDATTGTDPTLGWSDNQFKITGILDVDAHGAIAGQGGQIRFEELAANGNNYVGLRAGDALTGDIVWRLPTADGSANQVLHTDGAGNMFWDTDDGAGASGAPADATYLTLSLNSSLDAERVATEGTYLDFTDSGANGTLTIALDPTEMGTMTFGAGSDFTWTFNATGASDPQIQFTTGFLNLALAGSGLRLNDTEGDDWDISANDTDDLKIATNQTGTVQLYIQNDATSEVVDVVIDGTIQLGTPLGVAYGGTGADLSATGGANQFLRQSSTGAAVTVSALADADIPNTITIDNITQITTRDHGSLTGLSDDDHTIYALLAGRSGGQTLIGGTAASNNLVLESTSNASKGVIQAEDRLYFADVTTFIELEGSSADANETILVVTNPTADRTVTIPDASGEVTLLGQTIESAEVTDGTLVNADISASAAIAISKLASGSSAQIIVANGSGVPTYVGMSGDVAIANTGATTIQDNAVDGSDLSLASEANGSIMYFNGTDWVVLVAGTNGQVLKLSSGVPIWGTDETTGGGGGSVNVEEGDATVVSGASSIDFGLGFDVTETPTGEANIVLDLTEDQVNLASEVTGTLPVGNGGTGVTSLSNVLGTSNEVDIANGTARVIGGNVTVSISSTPDFSSKVLQGANLFLAEGATVDNNEVTFALTDPTGDNTIAFPDASGEVSLLGQTIESSEIADGEIVNADISASAAIVLSKLASGSSAQIIVANAGGVPTYAAMSGDATISNAGLLTIADNAVDGSDISLTSEASGNIMYFNGTDWVRLATGSDGQVLKLASGLPSWGTDNTGGGSSVNIEEGDVAAVTGVATIDFGPGFDITETPAGEANIVLDYTEDPVNLASGEITGTLAVGNGGTGATTFTSNGVLLGNSTSAIQVTAAGSANQVFRVGAGGGAPAFGDIPLHASTHQNGGSDEINVAGLSGTLADAQPVSARANEGTAVVRSQLNFMNGANISIMVDDDVTTPEADITIAATGLAASTEEFITIANSATLSSERALTGTANEITLTDNGANSTLVISLPTLLTLSTKELQGATLFVAEGATANAFESTFAQADVTADRTYTFPDASGEVSLLGQTISSAEIIDGEIVNADISSSAAVALSKLASGTSAQIIVANSSGVPTYVALSGDATIATSGALTIADNAVDGTDISLASEATGDVMYFNGTDWVRLGIGSTGQVIKVAGGLPSWGTDNTGSGSSLNIEEGDATVVSGATVLDFGPGFDLSETPAGEANVVLDYTEDPPDLSTSETTGTLAANRVGNGLTDTQVNNDLTINQITSGTFDLDRDNPTTNEGRISWNASDNRIQVGEAGGVLEFYPGAHLTQEQIEDYAGAMVSGNTETLIAVTYDDTGGKLNFVVDNDLSHYSNATSGFLTGNQTITLSGDATGSGSTSIVVTVVDDSHNHVITNIDAFTKAQLEAQVSDVDDFAEADGDNYTGVHDFGGASSLEIPNGTSVTTDVFGELGGDNNAWASGRGAIQFYDGTANTNLVGVLTSDTPSAGQVPTFNAGGTITWEAPTSVLIIEEGDATVATNPTNIDFGAGFDLSVSPAGEVNVVLDFTEDQINLASEVTGTLPVANGGTGVTSLSDILGTSNEITVASGTARVIGGNVTLSLPTLLTLSTKELQGATLFIAEGATANAFEATYAQADVTADRTYTFPDATGEVSLLGQSISSAEIIDGEIVNADLSASAAIALSKLASGTAAQIIVVNISGVPTYVTASGDVTFSNAGVTTITDNAVDGTDISLASEASGNIMYFNGTDWVRLATGSDGQVLKLASGAPSWGSDNSGAAVQESDVPTVASVTTLDFGAGFDVTESPSGEANIVLDYAEDPVDLSTADVINILPAVNVGIGLNDRQVDDNISINNIECGTIDLDRSNPATNEGRIAWDAANNRLWVGSDAGAMVFYPGPHASSGIPGVDIEESNVVVAEDAAGIDFGPGFDVTESPAGEANITLDYSEDPVDLSSSDATGTLAAARFPALTGDVTTSAGSLTTTIADNAVDGTDISLTSEASGNIMYFNGTDWVRLATGSNGQVLKLSGGLPAWGTDDAGGSSINIEEGDVGVVTGVTVIDFGAGFDISNSPTGEANVTLDYTEDPVNLGTAEVTGTLTVDKGGTGAVTFTSNGVLYGNGTSALQVTSAGSSGQILLANVSSVPTFTSMSGDITINSSGVTAIGSGVIVNADISASAAIALSKLASGSSAQIIVGNASGVPTYVSMSGDISISNAGLTSIASGVIVNDDISASAAISLSKLASGSSAQIIVGNASGVPSYVAMSGDISISNAGATTIQDNSVDGSDISIASEATGNIMYYNGTDWVRLATGSDGQVLKLASGIPSWAADNGASINIEDIESIVVAGVTVIDFGLGFNVSSGPTGEANITLNYQEDPIILASTEVTGILAVGNGGSGVPSFTSNGVVYGNGSGALNVTAAGSSAQILMANISSVPTFTSMSGDITISSSGVTAIGSGVIVNADISASAAISPSKLSAAGGAGWLIVSNGSSVGAWVEMEGDAIISATGSVTIVDNAVDGTDITISSEANGSLMYYFGGTWVNLGIGSEGQVLKVVDGVPTWTTP